MRQAGDIGQRHGMTAKPGMSRSDEIMAQIESRVREFLSRVGRTAVGELDCLELEKEAMAVVKGVGLELMREVLRAADEEASEVVVHGERWGSRRVTKGTYTTKFGTVTLLRSGYQRSIKGAVLFPLDLRLGIVEGRYTPGMASLMAHTVAQMPAEDGERFLEEVGIGQVSKSTLHRIPQDMSAVLERDREEVEGVIRGEWRVPEGAHTVQVGLDGVMLPMEGEETPPRGRRTDKPAQPRHERHYGVTTPRLATRDDTKGVAYHEASVGTLSFFDRERRCLATIYVGRMPEYRKATLAATLEEELTAALGQCPTLQVALASDGAETHWEHLSAMEGRLPAGTRSRQLLDFCHGAKYLFDAAKALHDDEGLATALAEGWRSDLRHRKDGAAIVLRALRYQRDEASSERVRRTLGTIIDLLAEHKREGRLAYREGEQEGYPLGTGSTEAAAKTLVGVRMKRAGARYETHGGQTILNFRAAVLSNRHALLMRELTARYSAPVLAA